MNPKNVKSDNRINDLYSMRIVLQICAIMLIIRVIHSVCGLVVRFIYWIVEVSGSISVRVNFVNIKLSFPILALSALKLGLSVVCLPFREVSSNLF